MRPPATGTRLAHRGRREFAKTLKVETVMPNRLKIELDLGEKPVIESSPLKGRSMRSGCRAPRRRACARRSKCGSRARPHASRAMRTTCSTIRRARSAARRSRVFDGKLDADGKAKIDKDLDLPRDVPGMLNATFVTRVFERGGAFSINRETRTVAAFDRYVGLEAAQGRRGARHAAHRHQAHGRARDAECRWRAGVRPAPAGHDLQGAVALVVGIERRFARAVRAGREHVHGQAGNHRHERRQRAQWEFEIKYPEWGRYLVRACDLDGGHCTGRVFYIDWPSWAGAARDQSGPAANILMLSSDKQEYASARPPWCSLPEAAQGRALLTLESGSAILEQRWIEAKAGANRISIPITAGMAPGIYAAVTMVQPHANKDNDRPIRLYGVIPLKVTDPQTHLTPVVTTAAEWAPQSKASVTVSETVRAARWTTRWRWSTKDC